LPPPLSPTAFSWYFPFLFISLRLFCFHTISHGPCLPWGRWNSLERIGSNPFGGLETVYFFNGVTFPKYSVFHGCKADLMGPKIDAGHKLKI